MDTASDERPWDERVQFPRADIAAQYDKAGEGGQGNDVPSNPVIGTASLIPAIKVLNDAVQVLASDLGRGRRKQLVEAISHAEGILYLWDPLREYAEDDALPSHLVVVGTPKTPRFDAVWGNLLVQCKDYSLPVASSADLLETDALVWPPTAEVAEPDAYWQALPTYANRPFVVRSCCGVTALTPEAVEAALSRKASPPVAHAEGQHELLHVTLFLWMVKRAAAAATVTIRDKRLAQDYLEGLRRFLGGVLDTLRRLVVMILVALSHLAQAPSFLLVMLAVTRQYGRRGESDDHMLPAPALRHQRWQGAVCLAA